MATLSGHTPFKKLAFFYVFLYSSFISHDYGSIPLITHHIDIVLRDSGIFAPIGHAVMS